jgi:hypothetical protein
MTPRTELILNHLEPANEFFSEKARIPAWTDRILRKGTNLRQINYSAASLRFSDHRPVFATFMCTVSIVNEARRESLSRQIYEKRRAEVGATVASTQNDDTDDEDLIGYDPIEPGLPPASSDRRKWWLDNGQPARSNLGPPQKGFIPNPNRPSNPYTPTDEPDWVTVPRPEPRRSSTKSVAPPPPNPRGSSSNGTNGTRRLPPPFNPSTSAVSTLTKTFSQTGLGDSTSTFKPTAGQSQPAVAERRLSTSTTSSTSKKVPPPVGRKPKHLTSPSSSKSSPTLSTVSVTASRPSAPPAQPTRSTTANHTTLPAPPKRIQGLGIGVGVTYGHADLDALTRTSTPPPPPQPRRGGAAKKGGPNGTTVGDGTDDEGPRPSLPPRRPTDLLGSDDGGMSMSMSGWEALKPN